MSRPKGVSNRPGYKKPGPKPSYYLPKMDAQKAIELKQEIVRMLGRGEAKTLTEAAEAVGISPSLAHQWAKKDEEFRELLGVTKQVLGDRIERELIDSPNVVAKIFLLKGYKPEFRDNAKVIVTDSRITELLEELKKAGQPTITVEPVEVKELPQGENGNV
jgi:transposase-like protein